MRRRIVSVLLSWLLALPLCAQFTAPVSVVRTTVTPSGTCATNTSPQLVTPGGVVYTCQNGKWAKATTAPGAQLGTYQAGINLAIGQGLSTLFTTILGGGRGVATAGNVSTFVPAGCTLTKLQIISDSGPGGAGNAAVVTISLFYALLNSGTPASFALADANATTSVTGTTAFNSTITSFVAPSLTGPMLLVWQVVPSVVVSTVLMNIGLLVSCQ